MPGLAFAFAQNFGRGQNIYTAPKPKKVDVLSPFYTWYDDNWSHQLYQAHTFPLRAPYHSSDPVVAAEQNDEKNHYGITVDLVSWWGPLSMSYQMFKKGYMRASNFESRKFCFLYEITGRLESRVFTEGGIPLRYFDFSDPATRQIFQDDLEYLEENYFRMFPNYYKKDGRPVLYIWVNNIKHFDEISQKTREKVYLVGSEFIFFPPDPSHGEKDEERIHNLNWYDAITGYGINPIYVAKTFGGLTEECVRKYAEAVKQWALVLESYAPQTELILPIQFAYHDNRGDYDPRDGLQRFFTSTYSQAEHLTKASRLLVERIPQIKSINLASYNEHWEGHGAEPSIQYQDTWLLMIKKYFKDRLPIFLPAHSRLI